MGRLSVYAILVLIGILAACFEGLYAARLSESQKCDILYKAISDYLPKHQEFNSLFDLMGFALQLDNGALGRYESSSRLKFVSSASDRRKLACKLAATKSRADVAKVFGIPKWQVDNLYVTWTSPSYVAGSVRKLDDITKVTTLLLIWAQNSGYPVMPFRHLNKQDFLRTFNAVNKVMMAKHVHDALINAPFPLKVTPNRAWSKLSTAKSYSELERGLMMPPGTLVEFSDFVKSNPGVLVRNREEMEVTMNLIKALDKTGILNFPR